MLDIGPFGHITPPPVEVASTSISATSRERIPSVTPESNQSLTSKSAQQRKPSSSFKSDSEFTVLNLSTQIQRKASWPSWIIKGWSKQHMWGMWGQVLGWQRVNLFMRMKRFNCTRNSVTLTLWFRHNIQSVVVWTIYPSVYEKT